MNFKREEPHTLLPMPCAVCNLSSYLSTTGLLHINTALDPVSVTHHTSQLELRTIHRFQAIMEKAPTRTFSWLKAPDSTFIFKTLYYKGTKLNRRKIGTLCLIDKRQ